MLERDALHRLIHEWPEIPRGEAMKQLNFILTQAPHLVKQVDEHGRIPLHEAIGKGDLTMLRWLLEAGSPVEAMKRGDWTPLMQACAQLQGEEEITLLSQFGADWRRRNREGWTPFHLAIRAAAARDINDEEQTKQTILAIIKLVEHLDPIYWWDSRAGNNGRSCLFTAARSGFPWLFDLIHTHTGPATGRLEQGMGVMANAVASGSVPMVKHLLKLGYPVIDQGDWQPIHVAAASGNLPVVRILLEAGADLQARSREGYTAREIAVKTRQSPEIINLLKTD